MTPKQFWFAKLQERMAAVQLTFVKPIMDLQEALSQYLIACEQERMQEEQKRKIEEEKVRKSHE